MQWVGEKDVRGEGRERERETGAERGGETEGAGVPVSSLGNESPAGLHLHIKTPLHRAHLHVLMQVPVHVRLGCGQLQLRTCRDTHTGRVSQTLWAQHGFTLHKRAMAKSTFHTLTGANENPIFESPDIVHLYYISKYCRPLCLVLLEFIHFHE